MLNVSIALKYGTSQVSPVKEASGFHDTSWPNVMKCDVYIRKELYANVVLSGGHGHFPRDRFAHDEGGDGVGSIHDEDGGGCSDSVWIGGSILSFPYLSQQKWISKSRTMNLALLSSTVVFVSSPCLRAAFPSNVFFFEIGFSLEGSQVVPLLFFHRTDSPCLIVYIHNLCHLKKNVATCRSTHVFRVELVKGVDVEGVTFLRSAAQWVSSRSEGGRHCYCVVLS